VENFDLDRATPMQAMMFIQKLKDEIEEGKEIEVLLEDTDSRVGLIPLSKRKADRIRGWNTIIESKKEGDVLDASNHLTDELSELPKWKVNLGIKAEWAQGFLAKATLRWVDDREVPYLGTPGAPFAGSSSPEGAPLGSNVTLQKMDAFAVVDLLLRVPVLKGHVQGFVTAGVENLFDESYEEELDFPAPGQTFFAAVELQF